MITVLQWNGRSVISNKGVLEKYMFDNKINIALLSETWFKPSSKINFTGFNLFRFDRDDGYAGVAILVKKNLSFSKISVNRLNELMCSAIQVNINKNQKINFYSVYVRPQSRISTTEWVGFLRNLKKPFILGGDFNSHNGVWGCDMTDTSGKNLLDALEECDLTFLNDGSETRIFTPRDLNKSAVDLTICSLDLVSKCEWSRHRFPLGSSDHYPILINIESGTVNKYVSKMKWNCNKADWSLFSNIIEADIQNQNNLEISYDSFIEIINNAGKDSIAVKKKVTNPKFNKIWWNDQCKQAINLQNEAFLMFKRQSNIFNYIAFKKASANVKKIIKESKKDSWRTYCNKLNRNTPIKNIWNEIKKLKNVYYNPEHQNKVIIKEHIYSFFDKLSPPWAPVQKNVNINKEVDCHPLLKPFSLLELEISLKRNANSAPGVDNIHYIMLYKLPDAGKRLLLEIFNLIWATGKYPNAWKEYLIIPIPKPNTEHSSPDGYRAISLASCVLKTFERIIKTRLEYWLESNNKISNTQFGFRKGVNINENIGHLVFDINAAFSNQDSLTALFIDLEGAYDNVKLDILYDQIIDIGLPINFAKNIYSLYSYRVLYLRTQNDLVGPRITNVGLPQGSILSPLLYILYTWDLANLCNSSTNVKMLQYADDICIYKKLKTPQYQDPEMSMFYSSLEKWCFSRGLNISDKKTQLCIFSKKHKIPNKMKINMTEYRVDEKVKYLGLIMDRKLLWNTHIKYLISKAEKGINILRAVCHTNWGSDPSTALLLYRSFIRSVLDYGCIFYSQAAKTHLQKLDVVTTKCLRLSLGALKSTPNPNLYVEAAEMPLLHRRQYLTYKFQWKLVETNSRLIQTIHNLFTLDLSAKYWKNKKSLLIVETYASSLNNLDQVHISEGNLNYNIKIDEYAIPEIYFLRDYSIFPEAVRNPMFSDDIENLFPNHYTIYTDGSRLDEKTAAAFWDPNTQNYGKFKLNNKFSVYCAELVAILEALKYIREINYEYYAILSDSKSALEKIKNLNQNSRFNYLVFEILKIIQYLQFNNKKIKLVWVKAHCNIINNEIVDQLAKSATTDENFAQYKCTVEDISAISKKEVFENWSRNYVQSNVGKYYKNIQPNLTKKPWFFNSYLGKNVISKICRLRFNHALVPSYKYKIRLTDTSLCECGEDGSTEHTILGCSRIQIQVTQINNYIYSNNNIVKPYNLSSLLESRNIDIYKMLYIHMCKIGLQV